MKGFYSFFIFTIALLLCANKMSAFDFEVDGILYRDNCNPDIGLSLASLSLQSGCMDFCGFLSIFALEFEICYIIRYE